MAEPQQTLTLNVPPRTFRKLAVWTGILLLALGVFSQLPALRSVLLIVIMSIFLSILLTPFVNFCENRGVNRALASVLVFALIIFLASLGFKLLAPVVSHQVKELSAGLNDQSPAQVMSLVREKLGDNIPILSNPSVQAELEKKVGEILKHSFTVVADVLSAVMSMIMVAFMTFFFLKDGRRIKKTVISWVPNRYFEVALMLQHKIVTQLGRYIRGQLLVAFIVGALSASALYFLGVRYYFFIGAMAGLANMIPYFGPIVGALPAVVIAFLDTGEIGLVAAVVVAFASIQLIENVVVSPVIVAKSVELHPLVIIVVILIGGQLLGVFGMLLAVPAASIVKVTVSEVAWGMKHYRAFG